MQSKKVLAHLIAQMNRIEEKLDRLLQQDADIEALFADTEDKPVAQKIAESVLALPEVHVRKKKEKHFPPARKTRFIDEDKLSPKTIASYESIFRRVAKEPRLLHYVVHSRNQGVMYSTLAERVRKSFKTPWTTKSLTNVIPVFIRAGYVERLSTGTYRVIKDVKAAE